MSAQPTSISSGRSRHFLGEVNRVVEVSDLRASSTEEGANEPTACGGVPPHERDLVQKLIDDNQDIWKDLLDNKFCRAMKEAPNDDQNVLRGFEWYMKQDYYYVASLIEYEAARVPKAKTKGDLATAIKQVSDTVKYTDHFFKAVTAAQPQGLGVSTSTLLSTELSEVLKKYIELITSIAEEENMVLSMVALIAGLQSYYIIAADLYRYSDYQDTMWYKFWAQDNFSLGKACLLQQKYFIDNYKYWKDDTERITKIFRDTCQAELDLWDEALKNSA